MTHKTLFSRSLGAAPDRLHFAAHSHHLWPDAALDGHAEAAADAAALADHKWTRVFEDIVPAVRAQIASELRLPRADTLAFAPNTHELVTRMASCFPTDKPLTMVTTDGEFHSLSRQLQRWEEAGQARAVRVPVAPFDSFTKRFVDAVRATPSSWVFLSHVFFGSGHIVPDFQPIAEALSDRPDWLIVDGYHAFMAIEVDFSPLADRAFYMSGGYKYAMAGEGACFVHAPPGFGPRPVNTGWFAAFEALADDRQAPLPDASDDTKNGTNNRVSHTQQVKFAAHAGRFSGATFDPSGLYRFLAVRRMLASEGLTTGVINTHVRRLQDQFLDDLQGGRVGRVSDGQVLAASQQGPRARFIAIAHEDAAAWAEALASANVVVDVRGDVIRFGFGLYHDAEDVARLTSACARVLG